MAQKVNLIIFIFQKIFLTILGIFGLPFIILHMVLSLPLLLYRFLITKVFAPCFLGRRDKVKEVNATSSWIAYEVLKTEHPPRSNLLINLVWDNPNCYHLLYHKIEKTWINFKDQSGHLRYPELQQYLISWMGFMFWKQDPNFNLKNHVILHQLDENGSEQDSVQFWSELCENLINTKWEAKRSPWKMHIVQNYKNSEFSSGNLTAVTLQVHHCMGDGYALLQLLLELGFGGNSLDSAYVPKPTKLKVGFFRKLVKFVTFPFEIFHEFGHVIRLGSKKKTIYHIPDNEKMWVQQFGRAPLIPISKVKLVKNTFDVSFAAVINSACATALGRMLKKLKENERGMPGNLPEDLLFGVGAPKPNHPKKLRIHVLGALFEVPAIPEADPIDRLLECENCIQTVKHSPMTLLVEIGQRIFSHQPSAISRFFVKNRFLATGVSIFPGPGIHIKLNEETNLLACDFAAGLLPGVAGTAFMMVSYVDKIRICATAEKAVLSKDELNELLQYACEEIDNLYELAVSAKDSQKAGLMQHFMIENETK